MASTSDDAAAREGPNHNDNHKGKGSEEEKEEGSETDKAGAEEEKGNEAELVDGDSSQEDTEIVGSPEPPFLALTTAPLAPPTRNRSSSQEEVQEKQDASLRKDLLERLVFSEDEEDGKEKEEDTCSSEIVPEAARPTAEAPKVAAATLANDIEQKDEEKRLRSDLIHYLIDSQEEDNDDKDNKKSQGKVKTATKSGKVELQEEGLSKAAAVAVGVVASPAAESSLTQQDSDPPSASALAAASEGEEQLGSVLNSASWFFQGQYNRKDAMATAAEEEGGGATEAAPASLSPSSPHSPVVRPGAFSVVPGMGAIAVIDEQQQEEEDGFDSSSRPDAAAAPTVTSGRTVSFGGHTLASSSAAGSDGYTQASSTSRASRSSGGSEFNFITTVAYMVEEEHDRAQIEEEIRNQLIRESVHAGSVEIISHYEGEEEEEEERRGGSFGDENTTTSQEQRKEQKEAATTIQDGNDRRSGKKHRVIAIVLLAAMVVALVGTVALLKGVSIGGAGDGMQHGSGNGTDVAAAPIIDNRPLLEIVRERGYLRCGLFMAAGFCTEDPETGTLQGINVDQCRAISMAVFGTPDNVEPVFVDSTNQFEALANHSIDVITKITTHTLSRGVYEQATQQGYTFSVPYFYEGLVFGGIPSFVECADNVDFTGSCRDLTICVAKSSTIYKAVKHLLPGSTLVTGNNYEDLRILFEAGACNVVAGGPVVLSGVVGLGRDDSSLPTTTVLGRSTFSREPVAVVTRQNDAEWSNLVNLVINVFFLAEAHDISKSNAYLLGPVLQMTQDPLLLSMMEAVVSDLGNYGDLYEKHLENIVPRNGLNELYDNFHDSSGLLYYMPFGVFDADGEDPMPNMTIARVQSRGHLLCGVNRTTETHHSEAVKSSLVDFDIEFCRAVAAALFAGIATNNTVKIVHLSSNQSTDPFSALAHGDVDVVAGARMTLQADYHEPTTGQGYTFSAPYYYDNANDTNCSACALMTTENDPQWAAFVNWVVMAMFYAEDKGIGMNTSSSMPIVGVFGGGLKQMLLDCILAVGSYSEAYSRTMEMTIPRTGANRLNEGLRGAQHYPIPYL